MAPHGLGQFYQKYTEAYGIPVLGKAGGRSATEPVCLELISVCIHVSVTQVTY